jgi:hypothetical protein
MKRRLSNVVIVAYILSLVSGFLAISFHMPVPGQTFLYFMTFNMFAGWCGYEARMHVIGQGESGWGEFHPYGWIPRQHYDPHFDDGWPFAANTLKHTVHEPMLRVYVVEEEYPKKLNFPAAQYEAYYNKPKDFRPYYSIRFIFDPHGKVLAEEPEWLRIQDQLAVMNNPRLVADACRSQPFDVADRAPTSHGLYAVGRFYEPPRTDRVASPLAE